MFLAVTKQSDLNCGPNHPESSLNPVVPANVSVFPRSLNSPICPSCSSCHYGAFEWQLSRTISVTFTAVPVWRRKWKEKKKKKNQGSPAAKREKWLHKIHTDRLRDDNVSNVNSVRRWRSNDFRCQEHAEVCFNELQPFNTPWYFLTPHDLCMSRYVPPRRQQEHIYKYMFHIILAMPYIWHLHIITWMLSFQRRLSAAEAWTQFGWCINKTAHTHTSWS